LPECALPEESLGHNLGEHCLEDTGPSGALPTRARGGEGALAPSCRVSHGHEQIQGEVFKFHFFSIFQLAAAASRRIPHLQRKWENCAAASRKIGGKKWKIKEQTIVKQRKMKREILRNVYLWLQQVGKYINARTHTHGGRHSTGRYVP